MHDKGQKEAMKFWGKFFVYVGQILAIISAVKVGSIPFTVLSIMIVFVGCVMHESSE